MLGPFDAFRSVAMTDQTLADPLLQIWVQILLTRENPKPLVIGLTHDAVLVIVSKFDNPIVCGSGPNERHFPAPDG